jgi:hypothetical protein
MNQNELECLTRLYGELTTRNGHWLAMHEDDREVIINYFKRTLPLELLVQDAQEMGMYEATRKQ